MDSVIWEFHVLVSLMWGEPGEGNWHLLHTYCVLGNMQSISSWNNNDNNNSWHLFSFIMCYEWDEVIHLYYFIWSS